MGAKISLRYRGGAMKFIFTPQEQNNLALLWVSKALLKKIKTSNWRTTSYVNLDKICVHNDQFIATDGFRIHKCKMLFNYYSKIPDGIYTMQKDAKSIVLERAEEEITSGFPDYRKMLPTENGEAHPFQFTTSWDKGERLDFCITTIMTRMVANYKVGYNYKYIADALSIDNYSVKFTVKCYTIRELKVAVFEGNGLMGKYMAIIAPVVPNNEDTMTSTDTSIKLTNGLDKRRDIDW